MSESSIILLFYTIRPVTVSVHVDMNFAPVAVRIESHGRREKGGGEEEEKEEEEVEAARRLVAGRKEEVSFGVATVNG